MGTLLKLTGAIALTASLQLFVSTTPATAVDVGSVPLSEAVSNSTLEQMVKGIPNFEPPDNGGPSSTQGSGTR